MFSFIPEFFLVSAATFQLLHNVLLINNKNFNFPLIYKETFYQTVLIVVWLLVLLLSLKQEAFSFNSFFLNNLSANYIKISLVGFSILVLYILFPAFVLQKLNFFEFFTLFLFSLFSLLLLISSHNLVTLYLSVEMQVLCYYVLAAFSRNSAFATESGLKYFITSSFVSGLFLFGIFLIYCSLGTLSLLDIQCLLSFELNGFSQDLLNVCFLGIFLVTTTLLFKLTCAPYHTWAPDVYEGAPLSSTIVFSILPKISLVFFLIKWVFSLSSYFLVLSPYLMSVSLLSCLVGTIFSLYQQRVKRLVIYSSIGQVGFLILGLSFNSLESFTSVLVFLFIYILTGILIWGHISVLQYFQFKINSQKHIVASMSLSTLAGFYQKNKIWSFSILIIFFSISGIPALAGFYAKALILYVNISENSWFTALSLILISSISVFYYIRIIKVLFFEKVSNKKKDEISYYQVIFIDQELKTIYFIFASLLFLLITVLLFPTNLYLFCELLILKIFS